MKSNTINPDQTTFREQSVLGPFCLKYKIEVDNQRREQTTVFIRTAADYKFCDIFPNF